MIVLVIVTLLAFANAWPENLVLDDKAFAGPGRSPDLDSLQYMFAEDVWVTAGTTTGLYRPLLLLDLSLESRLFGDWLAGYHLSNIFLHLIVTLLVYGLLRHILLMTSNKPPASELYALLAALIFAVHPIHTEVVNSVFNRSGMLVAIFYLAGMWWLLQKLDTSPLRAWLGLGVAYFLAMLCKESAVVIPGLAVGLILILGKDGLSAGIRKCLPVFWLLLPLAAYFVLRHNALTPEDTGSVIQAANSSISSSGFDPESIPDAGTLLSIAGILGESMKVMVWPYPLHLNYASPSTLMSAGYLAVHLVLIIISLILLKKNHRGLAAGLAFFYIAMIPASRIFSLGNSSPHLAERYLYLPSIGLVIFLAILFRALAERFGPKILVRAGLPVLVILTVLTWDRNSDWVNEVTLFETEYQRGVRNEITLRMVTSAYLNAKNHKRVVRICDDHSHQQEELGKSAFVKNCAISYENQQRIEEAENAHLYAIEYKSTRVSASLSLAKFYLRYGREAEAEQHFLAAIEWSDDPAEKALNKADMTISLSPDSRMQWTLAKTYVEEALRLRPDWPKAMNMFLLIEEVINSPPGGS